MKTGSALTEKGNKMAEYPEWVPATNVMEVLFRAWLLGWKGHRKARWKRKWARHGIKY